MGDLVILNILWIVCSTLVSTAGVSITATCYVILKLVRDEDDSTIRSFFRFSKSSFRQVTAIWLILLAAGIVPGLGFWFSVSSQVSLNRVTKIAMIAVSGGLLLIYLFIITYVFLLQTRFYNSVKRILLSAFSMSVCHLFQTIEISATGLGIVAATCSGLFCFPQSAMLSLLFGMPLIAFINSYFFTTIFRKYMPKEGEQEHTDATPLLGEKDEEVKETARSLKGK